MGAKRTISVLTWTRGGAGALERQLAALATQASSDPWDLLVLDASPAHQVHAVLDRWREKLSIPSRVIQVHPEEIAAGDGWNLLAAESSGELCVYLAPGAVPASPQWLARLAAELEDDAVGLVGCAVSTEGENSAGRRVLEGEARSADELRLLASLDGAAWAVRRDAWVRHPFPRTETGGPALLAGALLAAGGRVVVDSPAEVAREPERDPTAVRALARSEGRFAAKWLGEVEVGSREEADARARAKGRLPAAERELHEARFHGLYEGARGGVGGVRGAVQRRSTRLLERGGAMKVLYVVHGFPPDSWAGTEVYTLGLALEVQRLGHRATVLCRTPEERGVEQGGRNDFELTQGELQGLSTWRMTHRIDHRSLRESYEHPRAEVCFTHVLERERPDVVHFQHVLHFSARLPEIAREHGVPSVLTCNDYWGLCARVQLIRPDGVRCEENQGMGCLVCVKDKDCGDIELARRWLPLARPLVPAARFLAKHPRIPSRKIERKLARIEHARRVLLSRWGQAYEDIRVRQDVVLAGYAAADLLIAPSRFLRKKYLDTGRFEPDRFAYSDYGMKAAPALAKRPDPGGRMRFGFVGSIVWYKGVDVLVGALRLLERRKAELRVHGAFRPESDAHHAGIRALAKGAEVVFYGPFDNARLAEVYEKIDVLVVPSVWFENSPLVIHEAFQFRTPVVASDIGGMAELVREGVDGLRFRAGDERDLARVLARFLDEPGLIERLSRDFPRVKSLEENAREMEWRYRQLLCLRRGDRTPASADPSLPGGRERVTLRP